LTITAAYFALHMLQTTFTLTELLSFTLRYPMGTNNTQHCQYYCCLNSINKTMYM